MFAPEIGQGTFAPYKGGENGKFPSKICFHSIVSEIIIFSFSFFQIHVYCQVWYNDIKTPDSPNVSVISPNCRVMQSM